jgi:hypothetical protein
LKCRKVYVGQALRASANGLGSYLRVIKDQDVRQMMLVLARNYVLLAERAEERAMTSPQSK